MSNEPQVLPSTRQHHREDYGLPGYDALAQILPEYQRLLKMPKAPQQNNGGPREQQKTKMGSELNQTFEIHPSNKRIQEPNVQDDETDVAEITEHETKKGGMNDGQKNVKEQDSISEYMKHDSGNHTREGLTTGTPQIKMELQNYRSAMCKMSEDILALRSQVASLEGENSQLCSELSMQQDLGRTLLEDTDIDVMTKAEIADRIVSLKCKLASESSKVADQRDKIQQLQNKLISKNDSEKELVRLQRAYQQQEAMLQHSQRQIRKLASLEATVRQQEKVIERMEKVLTTRLRERNKERNTERRKTVLKEKDAVESRKKDIESVLAAENSRLRAELESLRHQPPPVILQQPAQIQLSFADSERLRLLEQLERAEAWIRIMGRQMEDNARQWGREKQQMLSRLSEYNHGFARTSTSILHDTPLISMQPRPHM